MGRHDLGSMIKAVSVEAGSSSDRRGVVAGREALRRRAISERMSTDSGRHIKVGAEPAWYSKLPSPIWRLSILLTGVTAGAFVLVVQSHGNVQTAAAIATAVLTTAVVCTIYKAIKARGVQDH